MPPSAAPPSSPADNAELAPDSLIDSRWVDRALGADRRSPPRARADRAGSLLLLGLLAAAAVLLWLRMLAAEPHLPTSWRAGAEGGIVLDASPLAALKPLVGQRAVALLLPDGQRLAPGPAWLNRAPRWIVDDAERAAHLALRDHLGTALQQRAPLTLVFAPDIAVALHPQPRGLGGLGALCWVLSATALALGLAAAVVLMATPGLAAALYAVMGLCQAGNLLLIGAELMPGIGLPVWLVPLVLPLRLACDAATMAALVHVASVYPQRLAPARWLARAAWCLAVAGTAGLLWRPAGLWWWAQAVSLADGVLAALLLRASQRRQGGPLAGLLQRLVMAGVGTLALLSVAMAVASHAGGSGASIGGIGTGIDIGVGVGTGTGDDTGIGGVSSGAMPHWLATVGATVWYLFLATLLLLGPFLSRSRQLLRELAVLAGVSTVASSLDLLFETVLALGPVASLLLALGLSLALYAVARPWILDQLAGSAALSGERMFDSLYRAAREIEQAPQQAARQISRLLREVFDPLEVARTAKTVSRVRVAQDGSTLVVPIPLIGHFGQFGQFGQSGQSGQSGHFGNLPAGSASPAPPDALATGSIVLRHARRGRRLFTRNDLHLTEQLVEQLLRAVAYDRAVEQGRTEERTRIAQDLHDDIGARLLTLMYKAPNLEVEEYIRHTLQDLKTLTRGLAAANHRLSHAAAEWKSDITLRLAATGCDLHWSFSADRDLMLSVVQWSGLTRVLRELVNNIITHAGATQVEITAHFDRGRLDLTVSDDGQGRAPQAWAHGLGLGGVRKRVKLLGGQVQWQEQPQRGIRCEVRVPLSSEKG